MGSLRVGIVTLFACAFHFKPPSYCIIPTAVPRDRHPPIGLWGRPSLLGTRQLLWPHVSHARLTVATATPATAANASRQPAVQYQVNASASTSATLTCFSAFILTTRLALVASLTLLCYRSHTLTVLSSKGSPCTARMFQTLKYIATFPQLCPQLQPRSASSSPSNL